MSRQDINRFTVADTLTYADGFTKIKIINLIADPDVFNGSRKG